MKTIIEIGSDESATLTTDHPASSYGMPLLIYKGIAYGQDDFLPLGEFAEFLGDNTARHSVEMHYGFCVGDGRARKMPKNEYNLIAKFLQMRLAHS
jgi:hypothetical protein